MWSAVREGFGGETEFCVGDVACDVGVDAGDCEVAVVVLSEDASRRKFTRQFVVFVAV